MRSLLREFIRESLQNEAISPQTFNSPVTVYKKIESNNAIKDLIELLTSKDSAFVKWMNSGDSIFSFGKSSLEDKNQSKNDTSSKLVSFFRLIFAKGEDKLGPKVPGSEDDAAQPVRKFISTIGVIGSIVSGYSLYKTFFGEDEASADLAKIAANDLTSLYSSIMDLIGDNKISASLISKSKTGSFDRDWGILQDHYNTLTDSLASVASYEDYFSSFAPELKPSIDALIAEKSKNKPDLIDAYQSFAYATLVYYTAVDYLSAALMLDVNSYGPLSAEQQENVKSFLAVIENKIKESSAFLDAANAYRSLGLI